jgi:hypothetical protein
LSETCNTTTTIYSSVNTLNNTHTGTFTTTTKRRKNPRKIDSVNALGKSRMVNLFRKLKMVA